MYVVYSNGNGASLNAYSYWSSTEDDNNIAWVQNFYIGSQSSINMGYAYSVRAVRAF